MRPWILALLLAAGGNAPALAAEEPDEMLKRGVQLRRDGKDAEALEVFRKAYSLRASPRAAAQVGLAEQALGRWIAAEAHLTEALRAPEDPWIKKNRAALEGALESVGRRLATLEVLGGPVGAEVLVEGTKVGELPLPRPLRVPAGVLRVEVRAPGHGGATRMVVAEPRSHTRETIELRAAAVEGPPAAPASPAAAPSRGDVSTGLHTTAAPSSPPARPPALRWATGLAVGAGGALLVAGAAHGWSQLRVRKFNRTAAPTQSGRCDADVEGNGSTRCAELLDGSKSALRIAIPAYVTAGALGVTAGVLYLLSRDERGPSPSLACAPVGAGIGASCFVTF